MLRTMPVVLVLMTLVALPMVAAEIPGPSPEGLELEGIRIGQSLADVDSLLTLRNQTPVASDGAQRYSWLPQRNLDDIESLGAGSSPSHNLRKIDLVFRDGQVAEVEATYSSGGLLTRTTTELVERYGEPSSVEAPPESSIVNLEGRPYSLSLEMWTWRWDDATLLVISEHYSSTEESPEEGGSQHHLFRFQLAPAPGSFPER